MWNLRIITEYALFIDCWPVIKLLGVNVYVLKAKNNNDGTLNYLNYSLLQISLIF